MSGDMWRTIRETSGPSRSGALVFRTVAAACVLGASLAQQPPRPEFAPVQDVPGLPRVLIIGDSISIGYTLPLREALAGVANVHRPPENCAHTARGLERLRKWLGEGRWDLIHFNWGLHDLKHVDSEGGLALPPDGKRVHSVRQYEENLGLLVQQLQQTGAKLLWRPTTPVPEGAAGRFPADVPIYNEAALRVMTRHGVAVDDLNAFIKERAIPHVRPDNVHFSKESSALLAQHIAGVISSALSML
ncbi:MAG: SGNH/GDSL hydrolase family protein [Bryobacterales bacterium]|nr:SGNH/GDSL hydrolase family protein [Bryobacterales bacterium]